MSAADLALLPDALAARSRSRHGIELDGDDALAAVAHLAAAGHRVETWEGWIHLPGGGRTRSLLHPGPFALSMDPVRAAEVAREGIQRAVAAWTRAPEYDRAALSFGILVAPRHPGG